MKRNKKKRVEVRGGLSPDKFLSDEEISIVRRTFGGRRDGGPRLAVNVMLFDMFLNTGLRAFEMAALDLMDLPSPGKCFVYVRHGKGDVSRKVEVCQEFAGRISAFVRDWRKGARHGSPLFVSERGGRMSTAMMRSRLAIVGKAAGLHLYPHRLRHTFACKHYKINQDLLLLQEQMGHADPRTTAIYARTESPDRIAKTERLGQFLMKL